jgi:hypothetical protein
VGPGAEAPRREEGDGRLVIEGLAADPDAQAKRVWVDGVAAPVDEGEAIGCGVGRQREPGRRRWLAGRGR